jgi:hypothetical protein
MDTGGKPTEATGAVELSHKKQLGLGGTGLMMKSQEATCAGKAKSPKAIGASEGHRIRALEHSHKQQLVQGGTWLIAKSQEATCAGKAKLSEATGASEEHGRESEQK